MDFICGVIPSICIDSLSCSFCREIDFIDSRNFLDRFLESYSTIKKKCFCRLWIFRVEKYRKCSTCICFYLGDYWGFSIDWEIHSSYSTSDIREDIFCICISLESQWYSRKAEYWSRINFINSLYIFDFFIYLIRHECIHIDRICSCIARRDWYNTELYWWTRFFRYFDRCDQTHDHYSDHYKIGYTKLAYPKS